MAELEATEGRTRTLFRHIHGMRINENREAQKMPIMTVATHAKAASDGSNDLMLSIGLAVCSMLDMPSRRMGRAIAGGRAEKAIVSAMGGDDNFADNWTHVKENPIYLVESRDFSYLEELRDRNMLDFGSDIHSTLKDIHVIKNLRFRKSAKGRQSIPEHTVDFLLGNVKSTNCCTKD